MITTPVLLKKRPSFLSLSLSMSMSMPSTRRNSSTSEHAPKSCAGGGGGGEHYYSSFLLPDCLEDLVFITPDENDEENADEYYSPITTTTTTTTGPGGSAGRGKAGTRSSDCSCFDIAHGHLDHDCGYRYRRYGKEGGGDYGNGNGSGYGYGDDDNYGYEYGYGYDYRPGRGRGYGYGYEDDNNEDEWGRGYYYCGGRAPPGEDDVDGDMSFSSSSAVSSSAASAATRRSVDDGAGTSECEGLEGKEGPATWRAHVGDEGCDERGDDDGLAEHGGNGLGFGGSSGGPPLSFSTSFSGYSYDTHRLRPQLSSESHIRARYLRIERHYEERRLREEGVVGLKKKQKKRSLKIGKKGVRIRREGEEEEEEEEEKQPEFLELASEKKSNGRTRLSPKVLTRNVLTVLTGFLSLPLRKKKTRASHKTSASLSV